jgi:hypothetical protein
MANDTCTRCGSVNESTSRFCINCGSPLVKEQNQARHAGRQNASGRPAPAARLKGPPVVLLALVFTALGIMLVNQYTDLKPLAFIQSLLNNNGAQAVQGRYECHLEQKDMGGGVGRTEQTWAYVFYANGKYTTYLEGSQQFSGTWSQTGNILTVHVPEIKNISQAYSYDAIVSFDGNSFTAGDQKYVKVPGS